MGRRRDSKHHDDGINNNSGDMNMMNQLMMSNMYGQGMLELTYLIVVLPNLLVRKTQYSQQFNRCSFNICLVTFASYLIYIKLIDLLTRTGMTGEKEGRPWTLNYNNNQIM